MPTSAPALPDKATVPSEATQTHHYGTRITNNIQRPMVRTNGTVTYSVTHSCPIDPTSHLTAIKDPL
jgi:hypothetical protein